MEENRNINEQQENTVETQVEQKTTEDTTQQVQQPSAPINPYAAGSNSSTNVQYQPAQNTFVSPLLNQKNTVNHGMAIASMVLGIAGIVLCCCCGLSIITGIVGLILGIVARAKGNNEGYSLAGIILNGVALALTVAYVIYCVVVLATDPTFLQELEEAWGMYETYDMYDTPSNYTYYYDYDYTAALGSLIK